MRGSIRASLTALLLAAAPAAAQQGHGAAPATEVPPPLYGDLGTWTHHVTATPEAQLFFDQGLRLYYGFNHAEAIRAFRQAARLDPDCAMAWWGVAISSGPNINIPMDEAGGKAALEAMGKAVALEEKVSPDDRAYIEALKVRYSADPKASRAALDTAYCASMRALWKARPDDADAGTLYAESILDLNPWNQWTHDGQPNPGTLDATSTLEAVLKAHPDQPGANHFYIHAVEASPNPERANACAKRLETLVPGAGHLVHMPSHIYARTGRYEDAVQRNRVAAAVDEKYIADQKPEGVYPLMYYNHNIQFIWFAAMMEGRSAESLAAAKKIVVNLPPELIAQMPMMELAPPYPILTLIRFGRWDEALQMPLPPASERFATGLFHYARGMASAAKGDAAGAQAALDSLRAAQALVPADLLISINAGGMLLRVADHALEGEIAARAGRWDEAIQHLRLGVAAEDSLHYDEPPTWYAPVRQWLGVTLLKAGRAKDAEAVYREDLRRHPENGWSLRGLANALKAEGRAKDAAAVEARFAKAWARADVKLAASAF